MLRSQRTSPRRRSNSTTRYYTIYFYSIRTSPRRCSTSTAILLYCLLLFDSDLPAQVLDANKPLIRVIARTNGVVLLTLIIYGIIKKVRDNPHRLVSAPLPKHHHP